MDDDSKKTDGLRRKRSIGAVIFQIRTLKYRIRIFYADYSTKITIPKKLVMTFISPSHFSNRK